MGPLTFLTVNLKPNKKKKRKVKRLESLASTSRASENTQFFLRKNALSFFPLPRAFNTQGRLSKILGHDMLSSMVHKRSFSCSLSLAFYQNMYRSIYAPAHM